MKGIDEIKGRILKLLDPNDSYSQYDFDEEFKYNQDDHINPLLKVKFKNLSLNEDPRYTTDGASGFDLRANCPDGEITLIPGGRSLIPTGLYFELPVGYELQIRPRSGLAFKNGVTVLNSPGTVDEDYRGEIKIILINHGNEDFIINHGDRIAQGVIAYVTAKKIISLEKISELSETKRGSDGFGSTGLQ